MRIRIGSRKSKLALAQAHWVARELKSKDKNIETELVGITTQGDRDAQSSLKTIGGKGVFVKEIEEALLKNEIDLAVHSLKDVPQSLAPGLMLAAFPKREDPRDAFISRFGEQLHELPKGSTIGTGSPRRQSQVLNKFKDRYKIEPIRGNVDTRLKKCHDGAYDAIIMAVAGLKRLGLDKEITEILEPAEILPAPGQGCLGLEIRSEDQQFLDLVSLIKDETSDLIARAERAFLQGCGGDCMVPLAALGEIKGNQLKMRAMILSLDGAKKIEVEQKGDLEFPELVGAKLAGQLLQEGGAELIQ